MLDFPYLPGDGPGAVPAPGDGLPGQRYRTRAPMLDILVAIGLVVGVILSALLAIAVTRWALHM